MTTATPEITITEGLTSETENRDWNWSVELDVPVHFQGDKTTKLIIDAQVQFFKETKEIWSAGIRLLHIHRGKRQKGSNYNHFVPKYTPDNIRSEVKKRLQEATIWLSEQIASLKKVD